MFERKKHTPPQKRIDSLIGAGTIVDGNVNFKGGLRIDGIVHGNVVSTDGEPGTLVISEQARVDGEIRVSHIVINGTVNGPVSADDYLELQVHSRVTGDVSLQDAGDARRRGDRRPVEPRRTGNGIGGRIEASRFGIAFSDRGVPKPRPQP